MPETKYTTLIYLAIHNEDAGGAGKSAARVYQDFLGRLMRTAPAVTNLRLALEEPVLRKDHEGIYECWSHLKAVVPDNLTVLGADNARDAWRSILKTTFNYACHHNHDLVYHTASRVELTRDVLPHEVVEDQVIEEPVDTGPKEMITVKVMLGGKEHKVEIPKGENLLDGVNDKGVDVKWDCKSGVCDTCKVQITNGMENLSPATDAEETMLGDLLKQGYRLSCQITANGPCEFKH